MNSCSECREVVFLSPSTPFLRRRTTIPFRLLTAWLGLLEDSGRITRDGTFWPLEKRSVLMVGLMFGLQVRAGSSSRLTCPDLSEICTLLKEGSRVDLLDSDAKAFALFMGKKPRRHDYDKIESSFATTNRLKACSLPGFLFWFAERERKLPELHPLLEKMQSRFFAWRMGRGTEMPIELGKSRYDTIIVASSDLNGCPPERRQEALVSLFQLVRPGGSLWVPAHLVDLEKWKGRNCEVYKQVTSPIRGQVLDGKPVLSEQRMIREGGEEGGIYLGPNLEFVKITRRTWI